MTKQALVAIDHVSRYYGDHCAVDDVSFSVNHGEVLGLLGVNGSGKSTTMQMICGVLSASAGDIVIAGYSILKAPKIAKSHLGFLPDRPPLYPDLTVDEYLYYAARLRGIARREVPRAVNHSKQRCGLQDSGDRLIRNLSRGFQQRTGIAQAIIHSPAIVVLDEPTSGLDPHQIIGIRKLIAELGVDHSVILSTHILSEVQSVCSRVLIINRGKLVLDQHMDELQQGSGIRILEIAMKRPPPLVTLSKITGVTKVEQIGEHHFRFHCQSDMAIIDGITRRATEARWGLYEMTPSAGMLEATFLSLTQSEDQSPPYNISEC